LLASLAAVVELVACLSRSVLPGRLRQVPRPPARSAVPAAVPGAAIVVIGSILPVCWGVLLAAAIAVLLGAAALRGDAPSTPARVPVPA
jgi:hypothetical protein